MKFVSLSITLLFWVAITPAQASDYYVGLGLGSMDQSGSFDVIDKRLNPGVGIDSVKNYQLPEEKASLASAFIGYRMGRDIALEVGYSKSEDLDGEVRTLSTGEDVIESSSMKYYYAAFTGILPIGGHWAVGGRVGFSVWHLGFVQSEVNTALQPSDPGYVVGQQFFSDEAPGFLVGVSLHYGFNPSTEMRISAEYHKLKYTFTNLELDYDAPVTSLALIYHF